MPEGIPFASICFICQPAKLGHPCLEAIHSSLVNIAGGAVVDNGEPERITGHQLLQFSRAGDDCFCPSLDRVVAGKYYVDDAVVQNVARNYPYDLALR